MSKPREFWITESRQAINSEIIEQAETPVPHHDLIHVIEKSAYDDVKALLHETMLIIPKCDQIPDVVRKRWIKRAKELI